MEISSPSTRRRDLTLKRALYERHGVEEYWFVDRDDQNVLIHRLQADGYGEPERVGRGQFATSSAAPGFQIAVDELFDR